MEFAPETIVTAILFSMIGYFNGHEKTVWVMIQVLFRHFLFIFTRYIIGIQPNMILLILAAPIATCFGILLNVMYYQRMKRHMA